MDGNRLCSTLLLAVMLCCGWGCSVSRGREQRQASFSTLRLGMQLDEVVQRYGQPQRTCQGGQAVRLLQGQFRPAAGESEERLVSNLEQRTRQSIVYGAGALTRDGACGPAYEDTALGFDELNWLIWFSVISGESWVVH